MQLVRKNDAKLSLEGPEVCREYIVTPKITFGTSTLLPGQRGDIDLGHPDSHEVFFVVKGHVLLLCEKENKIFELFEQDAILMPEGVTHTLVNIGEETAVISWSKAPSEI
ncbi:MAG: cupin domain-containing protein [Lachnospiraceae bacterium]|nr:cupin domain-containing protein [Lachnospiraceae bacterium]